MDPSKALPENCHTGGYEESPDYKGLLYIGRTQIDDELAVGKVIDIWKTGYCMNNRKRN